MWVRELELVDFRSYDSARVEFTPGPVVLVGANGQGKTNLVEAIGYAAALDSHRVHGDASLVRIGAQQAVIRLTAVVSGRDIRIELELNPGRANRARLNGAAAARTRDVLGVFRCVTFAPEDLRLVKGDPADRRRFLDGVMVQAAPRYAGVRTDFERVLKQRNALLRSSSASAHLVDSLAAWDSRYLPLAAELTWGRLNAVRRLRLPAAESYTAVSPAADTVAVTYESDTAGIAAASDPEQVMGLLADSSQQRRAEEIRRGVTLIGPHRDDLGLGLNDAPAKTHASHGESWSLALALRLASFRVLTEIGGESPVLILDDVFAELDEQRRERLVAAVADAEQTIVTAAVPADVPAALAGQRWQVHRDQVSTIRAENGSLPVS